MNMMLPLDLPLPTGRPGEPVLPGFRQQDDFITHEEERALAVEMDRAGLTPFLFQQWIGKRLTRSFGWSYDFQSGVFAQSESVPDG